MFSARIENEGDRHWYHFTAPRGSVVNLDVANLGLYAGAPVPLILDLILNPNDVGADLMKRHSYGRQYE